MALVLALIDREAELWLSQRRVAAHSHPSSTAPHSTTSAPNALAHDSATPECKASASAVSLDLRPTESPAATAPTSVAIINRFLNELAPFASAPAAERARTGATVDGVVPAVLPSSQLTVPSEDPSTHDESGAEEPATATDVVIRLTMLSHRLLQCAQYCARHRLYATIITDVIPVLQRHAVVLMQGSVWPVTFFRVLLFLPLSLSLSFFLSLSLSFSLFLSLSLFLFSFRHFFSFYLFCVDKGILGCRCPDIRPRVRLCYMCLCMVHQFVRL